MRSERERRRSDITALSLLSSLGWAAVVMGLVAWLGPASFAELGLRAWWTPLVPAALVIAFSAWLARVPGLSDRDPQQA